MARLTRRDTVAGVGGTVLMGAAGIGALAYKGAFIEQALVYGFPGAGAPVTPLAATQECLDADETTPFAEGPFYSPNTPPKRDFLEPDRSGPEIHLQGRVVDTDCRPIAGAVLDFWHVDQNAIYDNVGQRYRGHQFTDADGYWDLITLHPQPYDLQGIWRTAHLHVKVQGPDTALLTTQLYFPRYGAENARDGGHRPGLEVSVVEDDGQRILALFNFVLTRKGG